MIFAVMPNETKKNALNVAQTVIDYLVLFGARVIVFGDYVNKLHGEGITFAKSDDELRKCEAIICVGGDGTIIHAAKKGLAYAKPVLGINAGRLGFMAGLENNECHLLKNLIDGNYNVEQRMMLQVDIMRGDEVVFSDYSLIDAVVSRGSLSRVCSINTFCNGTLVSTYLTDGIIVSTQTGSTAYSLSAGGPIVDPRIECLLMTPICPHSLSARTVIFRPDAEITVMETQDNDTELYLTIDGEEAVRINKGEKVTVKKSSCYAGFIRIKSEDFYDVLKRKFESDK
ncbi:MAG: NAD(+)/NADH kinase [Clostridia bacterium]|nr:NAD(+)/NADH kinase [Clostridia bacterium]